MTPRIVIVALAAVLAMVAGAFASAWTGPVGAERPPRLSPGALAAAEPGCHRYRETVRPHLYGAGIDDLIEQIQVFRAARASLSRDLDSAITEALDRRLSRPLVTSLSHNGLLSGALAQVNADRIEAAFKTLSRWDRQLAREQRVASRIGLRRCMDAERGG